MSGAISLKPEDFGEGGNVPGPDKDYRIKEAVVMVGRYSKGVGLEAVPWNTQATEQQPCAVGLKVILVDTQGVEYSPRFYSGGGNDKLVPSVDGKEPSDTGNCLVANPSFDGDAKLVRSSNLATLISETINAGFPANKVGNNITEMFEGLLAFWMGKKATQVEGAKERSILVPSKITELPGEGKAAAKVEAEESDEEATERALKKLVKIVKSELEDKDELSRADLSATVQSDYDDDEDAKLMAKLIYEKSFKKTLGKKGFELEGETIKKEED